MQIFFHDEMGFDGIYKKKNPYSFWIFADDIYSRVQL